MRRRRRKDPREASNHDRWLVSYADFVTLLFAFFVVMYSISAVNEEKYKILSNSLGAAFYEKTRHADLLDSGGAGMPLISVHPKHPAAPPAAESGQGVDAANEGRQMGRVSEQFSDVLRKLIVDNLVTVKKKDYWIELEMNSELLFLSGDAELSKSSIPVLKKIAAVIRTLPNAINVEGHTDNLPIDTVKFPSNWELSAARATSVVQELIKEGIDPPRLSAIGYGEFHPIADNRIEEGRFKNRRVVLVLMSRGFSRYGSPDGDEPKASNRAAADAAIANPEFSKGKRKPMFSEL